jgi:glycerol-3-phosphate dehydrogenase
MSKDSLKYGLFPVDFLIMTVYRFHHNPLLQRDCERFGRQKFDALIIGGGINGAGIARDLALRGLSLALVDKGDFASGTSSASTKLIHGGLRYLEQFALNLVFESCRERQILQTIAPHLVSPMPFMIPVYRNDPRSLWTVRAGMILYDLLAAFRNPRRHRILSATRALAAEPALREEQLTGAAQYWDCRMDDARLCLENVLAAIDSGAHAANYFEVTSLSKRAGRVTAARALDRETGREIEIEAEVVINATGPWLDQLCALDGDFAGKLRPTRGTHVIIPRLGHGNQALYLSTGRDNRLFFVIPWGPHSLVGTTDVDYPGDPDAVIPTTEDVDYLLRETCRHLRCPPIDRGDVIASFAGLRPLVAAPATTASRISREHRIYQSASGLISVGGGKYTTYRAVAAEIASLVCDRIGRGRGSSRTAEVPLPGGATGPFQDFLSRHTPNLAKEFVLSETTIETLLRRYGARTRLLMELLRQRPELARPLAPDSPLLAAEVLFAAEYELARTPADFLRRRTPAALNPGRGTEELPAVIELLGEQLQASPEQRRQWQTDYLQQCIQTEKDS